MNYQPIRIKLKLTNWKPILSYHWANPIQLPTQSLLLSIGGLRLWQWPSIHEPKLNLLVICRSQNPNGILCTFSCSNKFCKLLGVTLNFLLFRSIFIRIDHYSPIPMTCDPFWIPALNPGFEKSTDFVGQPVFVGWQYSVNRKRWNFEWAEFLWFQWNFHSKFHLSGLTLYFNGKLEYEFGSELRWKSIAGPPIDRLAPKIDQNIGDYRFLVSKSSKTIQPITDECPDRLNYLESGVHSKFDHRVICTVQATYCTVG